MTKMYYQAVCIDAIYEEFSATEGVIGNGGHKSFAMTLTSDSLQGLLDKVAEEHGVSVTYLLLDSCEELGRLDVQVIEDEEGNVAPIQERARTEQSPFKTYLSTYFYKVDLVITAPVRLSRPVDKVH